MEEEIVTDFIDLDPRGYEGWEEENEQKETNKRRDEGEEISNEI
jgi:hypothetical protein